jgi:hypothetical protein
MLASIVFLFCSRDVGALGLVLSFAIISAMALGRLAGVDTLTVGWMDVGLNRSSCRGASAIGWNSFFWPVGSASARHSSVKLLQTLSAFLRSCLSVTLPLYPPMVLALLEIGPGWPTAPIMEDRTMASVAANSMALNTSGLTRSFVLLNAERSKGCASRGARPLLLPSTCVELGPEPRLGEAETVVAFVVAVRGRSSDDPDIPPLGADGAFPVRSSRWILDFNSSSSSQTVDGAAVEEEDSVPSTPWLVSEFC